MRLRWLAILFGAPAVIAGLMWADSQDHPHIASGEQNEQHRPGQVNPTGDHPILTGLLDRGMSWLDLHHEGVNAASAVSLALFTLALVGATFGLLRVARIQIGDMQDLLKAARDNADAAASQAISATDHAAAAVAQAEATHALERAARAQERAMRQLAEVTAEAARATFDYARTTEEALLLAQRPKLRVRNVVVRPPNVVGYTSMIFHPHQLVSGQLYFANIGGTEARIIEAHCEILWTDTGVSSLPMERPYEGKNPNFPSFEKTLKAGESYPLIFQSDMLIDAQTSDEILRGARNIYVMGFIGYSDEIGIQRPHFAGGTTIFAVASLLLMTPITSTRNKASRQNALTARHSDPLGSIRF
jgi:hypothetical protein